MTGTADTLRYLSQATPILDLRLKGKSIREIAETLGITRHAVCQVLEKEVGRKQKQVTWRGDKIRQNIDDSLTAAMNLLWAKFLVEPTKDNLGMWLSVCDRRREMLGLDAPKRTESVDISLYANMTQDQLHELAERRRLYILEEHKGGEIVEANTHSTGAGRVGVDVTPESGGEAGIPPDRGVDTPKSGG